MSKFEKEIGKINNLLEEIKDLQESCLCAFNDLEKRIKSLLELMKGVING